MSNANWMPVAGGLILIAVLAYFGFQGVDTTGLSQKTAMGAVVGKEHVPAKKIYRTDYVAGHQQVIPQFLPDSYVLKIRLRNEEISAPVDRSLFDSTRNGDKVAITYRQGRLTKRMQVTGVRPTLP